MRFDRTTFLSKSLALTLCGVVATSALSAQALQSIAPQTPTGPIFLRPYKPVYVPPVRLANPARLQNLIRAGKLYLTVQDAIALALESNLDLEFDRYNPLLAVSNLERFRAGGALAGVPSSASQAGTVASGEGVAGSQAAAGVSSSGGNSTSGNSVNANISQIGPVTPTLDPLFQQTDTFSHRSEPQPEVVQTILTNLVKNTRNYSATLSQGLISGGQVSISYRNSYLNENAPTDLLNPENGISVSFSFSHNLLQGFGTALNSRNITAAKLTLKIDDLFFKTEVINAVVNTLNQYYGLVADYADVRAKQSALELAQKLYDDNQKQVQLGTMAPLDVTTAEAQVASSQQDFVVSQTNLEKQQVSLKSLLSRVGLGEPLLREVEIIPLDSIEVPEKDDLPPIKDLITTALANRSDLAAAKLNVQNTITSNLGTANGLLPQLAVLAGATNQGLSGTRQLVPLSIGRGASGGAGVIPPGFVACPPSKGPSGSVCEAPDPYFVGGIGTALGQIFRRDFPSEHVGGFIAANAENRQAQADYAVDQLSLRQQQLQNLRDVNQLGVSVSNQVVALQQARAQYRAAVQNRILDQQLLQAEQKKVALGASTTYAVVQQQRDLANAQSSEVAALVSYSNARVSLDQALGTTLETNHVSLGEAVSGKVSRTSTLPASLPTEPPVSARH